MNGIGFKGVVLSFAGGPGQLKALRGQLGPGQSMLVVSPVGPAPDAVRSLKMAEAVAAAKGNGAGLLIVSPPGGGGPADEITRFLKSGTPEARAAARKVASGKIVFYDGAPKLGRHALMSFSGTPSAMRDALTDGGLVGRSPYRWGMVPSGKEDSPIPPERRLSAVGGEGQNPLARRLAPYLDIKDPKVLRGLMREGVTLPSEALRGVPPGYRVKVRAFGSCPDPASCKAAVVIASGHGDGPSDYVGGWLKKNFEKMAEGLRPGQLALVVSLIANSGKWPGSRGPGVGKAYADIMDAVAAAAGNPKAPFAIQAGSGGGQGLLFPIIQYLARDPAGQEFAQRLAKIVNSEALFAYPRSDWYHDLATLLKDNPEIKMDTVWSAYAGRYERFLAMLKDEEVPHPFGRFTFQRAGSHPQTFPMGVDSLMRGVDLETATAKLSEPHIKTKFKWGAPSQFEQSPASRAPVPVVGPGVEAKGLERPPAAPAAGPEPRAFTLKDAQEQIKSIDEKIYAVDGGKPFAARLMEKWDALQKAFGAAHVVDTFVRMPGEEVENFARYLKDSRGDFNAALASFFDGEFPGWRRDPAAREIMSRSLGAPPELLKKHHALWDPDGRHPDPGQVPAAAPKTEDAAGLPVLPLRRLEELKASYPAWRARNEAAAKARGYLPFDPTRAQAYKDGDIIDLTGIPGLEGLEALKVKCLGRCGSAPASEVAFIAHGMHGGDYSGDGNPVGPTWLGKGRLAATLADLRRLDARLKDGGKSMLLGYLFSQKDKGQERAAEPTRHWPTFMKDREARNGDITAALFYHLLGTSGVDPGATLSIAGFSGGGKFLKATIGFMMSPEGADLRRRLRTVAGMDETYWGTEHYVDLARLSAREGTPVTFHFIGQDRFSDQAKLRRELLGLYQSEKSFPGAAFAAQREEARLLLRGRQASLGEPSEFRFGQDSFRFERVRSHIDAIVGQMTNYFAERPGERGMGSAEPAAPLRPRYQWGRVFDGAGAPRQDIVGKGITVSPTAPVPVVPKRQDEQTVAPPDPGSPPVPPGKRRFASAPVEPVASDAVQPPLPPLEPELKSRIDAVNADLARRPSPQARLVEAAKKRLSSEQLDLLRKNAFLEARQREAAAGLPVNGLPLFAAIIQYPAAGRDQKLGELTFFDPKGNVLLAVPVDGSRPSVNGAPKEGTGLFYTNLVTRGQRGAEGPLGDGRGRHEAGEGWINLAPAEYLDQLARHYRVAGAGELDPDDARAARVLAGLPAEQLPEGDRNFKFCIRPDSGLASRGCWRTPDVLGTQVSQLITEGIDRSVLSVRPDGRGGVVVRKSLPIAMSFAPRADAAAAWERMRGQLQSLPAGSFFDGSTPRPAAVPPAPVVVQRQARDEALGPMTPVKPTPSPVGDEEAPAGLTRGKRFKSRGVPSEPAPDIERAAEDARTAREKLLERHVLAPSEPEPAAAKSKALDPRQWGGFFDGAAGRLMEAIVSPSHADVPAAAPPFLPPGLQTRGEGAHPYPEVPVGTLDVTRWPKDVVAAVGKHPDEAQMVLAAAEMYAKQYKLAPEVAARFPALALAVAYNESGFNPKAVSQTGVPGVMQLTSGTGRTVGVNNKDPALADMVAWLKSQLGEDALAALDKGRPVSNRDPIQNVYGGVDLLAKLLKQYKGNSTRAVDAYNGEGLPAYVAGVVRTAERLAPAVLDFAALPAMSNDLAESLAPLVAQRLARLVTPPLPAPAGLLDVPLPPTPPPAPELGAR